MVSKWVAVDAARSRCVCFHRHLRRRSARTKLWTWTTTCGQKSTCCTSSVCRQRSRHARRYTRLSPLRPCAAVLSPLSTTAPPPTTPAASQAQHLTAHHLSTCSTGPAAARQRWQCRGQADGACWQDGPVQLLPSGPVPGGGGPDAAGRRGRHRRGRAAGREEGAHEEGRRGLEQRNPGKREGGAQGGGCGGSLFQSQSKPLPTEKP